MAEEMIRVRAKEMGYYDHQRRRQGCVFDIPKKKKVRMTHLDPKTGRDVAEYKEVEQFSPNWMELVEPGTKLRDVKMPDMIMPPKSPLAKIRLNETDGKEKEIEEDVLS